MIVELIAACALSPTVADMLPDEIVWTRYMYGWYVGVTMDSEPPSGRRALRFPTYTANKGDGPLELRGGEVQGNVQQVNQRIFRTDGTWWDRSAGTFIYHPTHGHIHFENWTVFRLRQYLPGGGVGAVVRTGNKTSFCIIETTVYDNTLSGFNGSWGPYGCGQLQGQKPGWADAYGATLSGQYIDIEGVPDGTYWLEGEVDPLNNVLELDETNNVDRVLIFLGNTPPPPRDAYEDNDSKAEVDAKPEGGVNSANLGLVNARRDLLELSMDDAEDWFKFRLHGTGTSADYIRIESPHQSGHNMNLFLLDSNGNFLRGHANSDPIKQISLNGFGPGTFYAKIVRTSGANPHYTFTVEPDGNLPPNLELTEPSSGTALMEQSWELVPVRWISNDPEGDPKTVSLFVDRNPIPGDTNFPVDGFQDIPGGDRMANLNTATLGLGKWYVIGRAWDGGAYGYSVAPGAIKLYKKGDINFDGKITMFDYLRVFKYFFLTGRLPAEWKTICDMDRDGDFDAADLQEMREHMQ